VKIRIGGPDEKGKSTSRQITVCDATVDEVMRVIQPVLEAATRKAAMAEQPAPAKEK
jgi:hypothetical protein